MITIKELKKLLKEAKKQGVPSNAIILVESYREDGSTDTLEEDFIYSITSDNTTLLTLFFDKRK